MTVPLARHERSVTGDTQVLGKGYRVFDIDLLWIQSCHERLSCRDASGAVVKLRKAQTLSRQGINVRCFDLTAVATQVAETEVVGHNQNNVRLLRQGFLLCAEVDYDLRLPELRHWSPTQFWY